MRDIRIGGVEWRSVEIQELGIDRQTLGAILAKFPNAVEVDVSFVDVVCDRVVYELATRRGLCVVDLNSCSSVTNVAPLAACANLHTLDLEHTGVTDVAALAACASLHTLHLSGTGVTDVAPLQLLLGRPRRNSLLHTTGTTRARSS